ncbi:MULTISPECIES: hypothetical protein [Streptomyces]|uniref:Uncharacterized protein n=1 Tax=Streptomyces pseudovenezuelae TaxID=67350 RepID=A0A101N4N6_9ACTN|nr:MULTISPECIES: hypothetical protein [Streptomyces]KUM86536.1 hypothetical protein AQI94_20945 [Streptomyces pseudovenezuelae]
MFVLLLVLIAVLFGFGFLQPMWWAVAAVLVYGAIRQSRHRGGGPSRGGGSDREGYRAPRDYRDYRERRDRQDRWDRRYTRQNRARLRRENRRDHELHN